MRFLKSFLIKRFKAILRKNWLLLINIFRITFKVASKKKIIIVFDGSVSHGGLVDRLKGIISFYFIAKETGADFKIYFKSPFDLSVFLEPNIYNWSSGEADFRWNPFQSKFLYLMDSFNFDALKHISNSSKKTFIVYSNVDYISKYKYLSNNNFNQMWGTLFNELFKRSAYIEYEISKLNINSNRLAIHTRFTSLLGDFTDATTKSISNESKDVLLNLLMSQIHKIKTDNPNFEIYIFSDSIIFLEFIKLNSKYSTVVGYPTHLDYDRKEPSYKNHLKTFIDFFLIAESSKIYFLVSNEMYDSAFSLFASKINNNSYHKINIC